MQVKTFLIPALLLHIGCGSSLSPSGQPEEQAAPAVVRVIVAHPTSVEQPYDIPGIVRARQRVGVTSKLPGTVSSVDVKMGDRVSAGQQLATIEDREPGIELERAQAAVEAARRGREQAEKSVLAAQADARLATATLQRVQQLFDKLSAAQQELDQAVARQQAAQANVEIAHGRVEEARAHEREASAALDGAQLRLSYTRIKSPLNGYVVSRNVDPGAIVAPGILLLDVEGSGEYRLEIPVPESRLSTTKVGTNIGVDIPSIQLQANCRVVEVEPISEPGSHSSLVRVQLPSHPGLRSGLYGRATLSSESRELLVLPDEVIIRRGQVASVFLQDNGVARRRLVTLGRQFDRRTEILSGLQAGEEVISGDLKQLSDGSPVEILR